jgi:hypothetical protein
MSDLEHQNLATVQSNKQLPPATVASATTIAPTTRLSLVSGTIDVATVTPPVTGYHELALKFTDSSPGDLLTTGNVLVGTTTIVQNSVVLLFYDNAAAKYTSKLLA